MNATDLSRNPGQLLFFSSRDLKYIYSADSASMARVCALLVAMATMAAGEDCETCDGAAMLQTQGKITTDESASTLRNCAALLEDIGENYGNLKPCARDIPRQFHHKVEKHHHIFPYIPMFY